MSGGRCHGGLDAQAGPWLCYYAADPVRRPGCELTAEVVIAGVALCAVCERARSSLGKGGVPRRLPAGRKVDVLDWVAGADAAARRAEQLLAAAVTRARQRGHSWAEIGSRLEVTRQAVQQRFGRGQRAG